MDPRPLTVLLVDDDADMRLYLRSCLRGLTSPLEVIKRPMGWRRCGWSAQERLIW